MGYSYCRGKLCCDGCGETGGVRKVKCPFNYCPAPAFCAICKRKHGAEFAKYHVEHRCEERAKAQRSRERERQELIAAGRLVRCAAVGLKDGAIKVYFETAANRDTVRYMDKATYHAFPLLENVTIEYRSQQRRGIARRFRVDESR